jgi:Ricin-type beta-trefoil lectin domain/Putative Ig domain
MANRHWGRALPAVAGVAATAVLVTLALPEITVRASQLPSPGAGAGTPAATNPPSALDPKHPYRHGIVWPRGSAAAAAARAPRPKGRTGSTGMAIADSANNLFFHGGNNGIGVQAGPEAVYLVFWGSQWGSRGTDSNGYLTLSGDPSGEAPRLQAFFKGLQSGASWSGVMTQYCQNVPSGTQTCPAGAQHVGYPDPGALAGVWADESAAAPFSATSQQLQNEAVAAAAHFGNTTAAANSTAQYIIASPTGTHPDSFNTPSGGYCAWHGYVSSAYGSVMLTNLGYIPDMGGSCGANAVNSGAVGALDGVTIVTGHEYAETITDPTLGGWADSSGYENADKCAWISSGQGAMADIDLPTGSFPVQSTWANDSLSGVSGCMQSDTIAGMSDRRYNAATTLDTNSGIANYDSAGFSYSASALAAAGFTPGATINAGGITFTWPNAGPGWASNWVAAGQRLPLSGSGQISFLGSATNGPASGTAIVTYSDGSTQPVPLTLASWTLDNGNSAPPAGERTLVSISYRNGAVPDGAATYLFATAPVSLAAGKQVSSVTLPTTVTGGSMHIFAVGVGDSTTSNLVNVTNPGSQQTAYQTPASLAIKASDSATGQTLAYHASGLPPGLSIDSATGVISGTATATGRFVAGVTATDGSGALASVAFPWTIPVPTGPILGVNGLCVDDSSSNTANGNPIQMWGCNQTNAQTWGLPSDGTVRALGKCMTVSNGGTAAGSLVVLRDCSGAGSQIWRAEANGELFNPASGRCLEDPGSGGWGTQLDTATCSGAADQQWLTAVAGSGSTVGVTSPGDQASASGTAVSLQIQATDAAAGQTLAYHASGLPPGLSIGSATGLISGTLTSVGTSNVQVTVTDTAGASASAAFTWKVSATGPIVGVNGLCVDDSSSGTANGNPIQMWGCNQTNAQTWTLAADNTVRALGKCMTVSNGGTAAGSLVVLWDCSGAGSQIWRAEANGELFNPASGRCLEDPGSGGWGTQLDTATCSDAADQQWTVP